MSTFSFQHRHLKSDNGLVFRGLCQLNFDTKIFVLKKYTEIIDHRLVELGKSRAWLASQIGLSRQGFNKHWNNMSDGNLPVHHLEKISDVLGVNLFELRYQDKVETNVHQSKAEEPPEEYTRTITLNFTPEELRAILTDRDQRTRTMEQDIAELKRIIQEMKDKLK